MTHNVRKLHLQNLIADTLKQKLQDDEYLSMDEEDEQAGEHSSMDEKDEQAGKHLSIVEEEIEDDIEEQLVQINSISSIDVIQPNELL